MIIEKRLKTSTSRVSKYFDLNERYILSTYELETFFKLKKPNSSNINKVNSKSENVSLDPCTIRSKENGVVMHVLRETRASLDIGFEKCTAPEMFTGEQGLVKHIHDDTMTCLQPAERIHVVSKPIVSPGHLDWEKYFLENQTIELLEPNLEQNGLQRPEVGNGIQTLRQRRKETGKSTRLENDDDQFRLGECVVENGEDFGLLLTGEGNENLVKLSNYEVMEAQLRNLVKLSTCEVTEAQLRSEESTPLIPGIKNNANDDASDQEKASMQLLPVRHELYINTIGPLPIAPTRDKYILPDMPMSPRCHETVPVPETASTPLVETLLQIFRRIFPREIQADRGTLFMSISTTEFEKLGTYCLLQMPFTFKNYCHRVRVCILHIC
ncbi:uncharacterized protein TNIN_245951 [Trichonephila inaurata madagascariensis]|uniref:Integrase catalytic domain-containing protein n=1 Tax=Trichonephila inaurata madagascariensis TaxID=2747483 RepID=A0A8X6ML25_9ARAC|nr:uncharacterized protein TNIN_245951 [Trichonephila inaurata madagascariensis]